MYPLPRSWETINGLESDEGRLVFTRRFGDDSSAVYVKDLDGDLRQLRVQGSDAERKWSNVFLVGENLVVDYHFKADSSVTFTDTINLK